MDKEMILIDAHCHLGSRQFDGNREDVLHRMEAAHVRKAIIICCGEHDRQEGIILKEREPGFKLAFSIHPQDLEDDSSPERLIKLRESIADAHADMIGETGLDYYSHPHTKQEQLEFFRAQLEMASDLGLPVDIHSRKASADTLEMLKKFRLKGIIHSYSGSSEMADLYMKLGYHISFGASMLFPGSKKPAQVIAHMPIDRLLIETDAPYQSPVKGHIHEPADVASIYQAVSGIRNMEMRELAVRLEENFEAVFA